VRLWDVSSHQQLGGPLTGHNGTVYAVVFSPDGSKVASSSKTIRLWNNKSFADYRTIVCHMIDPQDAKVLWMQAESDVPFPGIC